MAFHNKSPSAEGELTPRVECLFWQYPSSS